MADAAGASAPVRRRAMSAPRRPSASAMAVTADLSRRIVPKRAQHGQQFDQRLDQSTIDLGERAQAPIANLRVLSQLEQLERLGLPVADFGGLTPQQRRCDGIEQSQCCLQRGPGRTAAEGKIDQRCQGRGKHHHHPEPQHQPGQRLGRRDAIDERLTQHEDEPGEKRNRSEHRGANQEHAHESADRHQRDSKRRLRRVDHEEQQRKHDAHRGSDGAACGADERADVFVATEEQHDVGHVGRQRDLEDHCDDHRECAAHGDARDCGASARSRRELLAKPDAEVRPPRRCVSCDHAAPEPKRSRRSSSSAEADRRAVPTRESVGRRPPS